MMLSTGVHVLRFTLMAVAVLVIVGGGVYFGFFRSTHEKPSSRNGSATTSPPGPDRSNEDTTDG
jgi:hypothetical protein